MCIWDLCEFNNLILGSIVGGIVGILLVIYYESLVHKREQKRLENFFKPLESTDAKTFDWICYNISGRDRSQPNGSMANIKYLGGYNLEIKVQEANGGPIWLGYITMTDLARGSLTFNYPGKYEHGFKNCYLGEEEEKGKRFNYWILVGDGAAYHNELVRREKRYLKK